MVTGSRGPPGPLPSHDEVVVTVRSTTWTPSRNLLRALVMSIGLVVLSAGASLAGLLIDGAYADGTTVAAGARGGDLATLVVVVPVLALVLLPAARGSRRAQLVWLGLVGYLVYASAYHVFAPRFSGLFLVHVALFVLAVAALASGLAGLDVPRVAAGFWSRLPVRTLGGFLVVVAVALAWMYGASTIRYAAGGPAPTDVLPYPEWRVHLGYALDLSLVAPSAALAGVWLWRRQPWGYVLASAWSVWVFAYQLNYAASHTFMAREGIAGVTSGDLTPWLSVVVFSLPAAVLLLGVRGRLQAHEAAGLGVARTELIRRDLARTGMT